MSVVVGFALLVGGCAGWNDDGMPRSSGTTTPLARGTRLGASGSVVPGTASLSAEAPGAAPATDTLPVAHLPLTTADAIPGIDGVDQVIVVSAVVGSTTTTTELSAYQRAGGGWLQVVAPTAAHIGFGGFSAHRREGDGTTPVGIFGFVFEFGSQRDPGVHLEYRPIVHGSCWGGSRSGKEYNRWRSAVPCGPDDEDLFVLGKDAYRYAAVIDFNYHSQTPGAGSGIFLHVDTGGSTAGCVSIPESVLVSVLRWLRPGAKIAIGVP